MKMAGSCKERAGRTMREQGRGRQVNEKGAAESKNKRSGIVWS